MKRVRLFLRARIMGKEGCDAMDVDIIIQVRGETDHESVTLYTSVMSIKLNVGKDLLL